MSITATLFGQMITFGLLVWFTMNFVWPPLMQALEERKKKIADGLAAGEKGKHELELADKKAKSFLKEAKDQAADIVNLAQKRANDLADEKREAAKQQPKPILNGQSSKRRKNCASRWLFLRFPQPDKFYAGRSISTNTRKLLTALAIN